MVHALPLDDVLLEGKILDGAVDAARHHHRTGLPAKAVQKRIIGRIEALAVNPRPHGVEKLAGEDQTYRVRVGEYRILYEVHDAALVVLVVKVGHRREVYR
jgi:mRNA interferase RelE/StbE